MNYLSKFSKNAIGGSNHTCKSSLERGKPQSWGPMQVIIAGVCQSPSLRTTEAPLPNTKEYRMISSPEVNFDQQKMGGRRGLTIKLPNHNLFWGQLWGMVSPSSIVFLSSPSTKSHMPSKYTCWVTCYVSLRFPGKWWTVSSYIASQCFTCILASLPLFPHSPKLAPPK